MYRRQSVLLAIVIVLAISFECWGATYYVDAAKGNDANPGTSENAAWRTIQKAADSISIGDTAYINNGFYDERVKIKKSGNANGFISYQAKGIVVNRGFTIEADYIKVVGFEITRTVNEWKRGQGIFLNGKYCEIKKNFIHDVTREGILMFEEEQNPFSTSYCVIQGNRLERAGRAGIIVKGRNNLIEGNHISRTLQYPSSWTNPPDSADADGMLFFGSGHIIRKNYINDILMNDPENIDPHIDCWQTWGPAYDIVFEQNYCENPNDRMQGFMIAAINTPVRNLIIRNNVIKAFRLFNVYECERLTVINNTFVSDLTYSGPSGYGIELKDSQNAIIQNNIFYNVGGHEYQYLWYNSTEGLEVGYNLHYISDGNPPKSTDFLPRPTDLWQLDPAFVDVQNNDFHLNSGSPVVDAGNPLHEVTNDFDGISRPQKTNYDIGAFEYHFNPPKNLKIEIVP